MFEELILGLIIADMKGEREMFCLMNRFGAIRKFFGSQILVQLDHYVRLFELNNLMELIIILTFLLILIFKLLTCFRC